MVDEVLLSDSMPRDWSNQSTVRCAALSVLTRVRPWFEDFRRVAT